MSHIIEAIQKRQLRTIERSLRYTKTAEEKVAAMAATAKRIINSENSTEADNGISVIRAAYYKAYKEYTGKESFAFAEPMNKRSKTLWTRVKNRCEESGVPPDVYIRAQFSWFDKNFGKAPTIIQLTTEAAVERAKQYIPGTSSRVVNACKEVKMDFASLMRASEKQMQDIMRAQNFTREEVYLNLVIPGFLAFPQEFLNSDPIYKKVLNG
jgi:hypothetical protein